MAFPTTAAERAEGRRNDKSRRERREAVMVGSEEGFRIERLSTLSLLPYRLCLANPNPLISRSRGAFIRGLQ